MKPFLPKTCSVQLYLLTSITHNSSLIAMVKQDIVVRQSEHCAGGMSMVSGSCYIKSQRVSGKRSVSISLILRSSKYRGDNGVEVSACSDSRHFCDA